MADLIAQGAEPGQRWRRELPLEQIVVLGRGAVAFAADWDDRISHRHAELCWRDAALHVTKCEQARNPIFVQGRETETFKLRPGKHFVIGRTTFTLVDQPVQVSLAAPLPLKQQTFSQHDLEQLPFRNARARIEVLGRLPEVISGAASDAELFVRLINLLLAGVPTADGVALVRVDPDHAKTAPVEVLKWDRRRLTGEAFMPSERLIREALARGQSVVHLWGGDDAAFTATGDADWAFCTPVGGDACRGWAIYVAGTGPPAAAPIASTPDPRDLADDLKFTEVASAALRSLHELRLLQRQHSGLSQFFSPIVLETLAGQDPQLALAPRETEVSVLFCDLRGFARQSEEAADDLLGLLDRVSTALGVTTRRILEQGGVVGDFQGDAVMGFWGWPLPQDDRIERVSRAALAIRAELARAARREGDPLAGFRMGIGIATGRAVAGKIGTVDQVKVTVFGPVVNLASRLEGMTKTLRAPILVDEATAGYLREQVPGSVARCRRLAVVRPFGLDAAVEVSELLPPADEDATLSDDDIQTYESALEAFQQGDWSQAFDLLHRVPAEDRAKDFLTMLIAQHHRTAPQNWQGVIELASK